VEGAHPALTFVVALAIGIVAQSVARHLRIPGIVLLLFGGAALGPDGLGWVRPHDLGEGLFTIVDLAVAVILFEGGLNLNVARLRRSGGPIRHLVTAGALITLVGAGVVAAVLLGWPWSRALLFGSLVVVTGPTVVSPLIRELRLRPRVSTVLEAEGVMIDPIGAILAVLLLEVTLAPNAASWMSESTDLLFRIGFGTAAGIAAGFAIAGLLRVRRIVPEGHGNIFVLAAVLLLAQGCNEILSHSGILAVTVAGIVVGNLSTPIDRDLREFKDQLTVLLIGLLFVLLAADVRFADVENLGWQGIAVVAALVVFVRPLTVAIATARSDLSWRERALIAWIAPRGIVAAAVASVTAIALEQEGMEGGAEVRALVFLTIAGTVILAGFTAGPVASLLQQRLPGRDSIAILGADGLGFHLGQVLQESGASVVFLDANPENCRRVEEAGFNVVFGDAVQERTMQRARFELVGDVIGVTPNQVLNSVFVRRARERFGVPRGYVAAARPEKGLAPELVATEKAVMLFEAPPDALRWDVRSRRRAVDIEKWVYNGPPDEAAVAETEPPKAANPGELYVILTLERGAKTLVMHADLQPKPGDRASIAVHSVESEAAHLALLRLGWSPYAEESEAEQPEAT
jgi:NhaP-type Na+/H+ or K+/H+ antiporter